MKHTYGRLAVLLTGLVAAALAIRLSYELLQPVIMSASVLLLVGMIVYVVLKRHL